MIKTESILVKVFLNTKTVFMKKDKELWVLRLVIAASVLVGYLLAYYYSQSINKWFFKMDMVDNSYLTYSMCISGCLFISGFVYGRLNRNR